jgi:hypothetical protein
MMTEKWVELTSDLEKKTHAFWNELPLVYKESGLLHIAKPEDLIYKERFLSVIWGLYNEYLEISLKTVEEKKAQKLPLYHCIPSQQEITQLKNWCLRLTELWYGPRKGNYSRVYAWWRELFDVAEVTAYSFEKMLTIDPNTGEKVVNLPKRSKALAAFKKIDRLPKELKSGRSPIDNLSVPTLFTEAEHQTLKPLFNQEKTKEAFFMFRSKVKRLKNVPFSIDHEGQLQEAVSKLFPYEDNQKSEEYLKNNYTHFIEFTKKNPGQYFANKETHEMLFYTGLLSNKLKWIPRSKAEKFTPYRYLEIEWTREYDLYGGFKEENFEKQTEKYALLRKAGSKEISRFRPNEIPYGHLHSLSMVNHGLRGSEWNKPEDPGAFLSNEYILDIERMAIELSLFNPCGRESDLLPGECFVQVAQNPRHQSSIKNTYHLQLIRGDLSDYPVYQQVSNPQNCPALGPDITVDCITMGSVEDACFYKIEGKFPVSDQCIFNLMKLRMALLQEFGGGGEIEFVLHGLAQGNGKFLFFFLPFCQLDFEAIPGVHEAYLLKNLRMGTEKRFLIKEGMGAFAGGNKNVERYTGVKLEEMYDLIACPGMKQSVCRLLDLAPLNKTVLKM